MIDILVPVLARPQNALPLVTSIQATTTVDYSILFLCSHGDEAQIAACKQTGARVIVADYGRTHEYPRKMNHGFAKTDRQYVFLAADDLDFQPGWDEAALDHFASVVATNDDANPEVKRGSFGTHNLVRRSYVMEQGGSLDGPGVLLHEGYDHNWVDRELCQLADWRGEYAFARDSIVRHRHPHWGTAEMDATYEKGLSTFAADQRLFRQRSLRWKKGLRPSRS